MCGARQQVPGPYPSKRSALSAVLHPSQREQINVVAGYSTTTVRFAVLLRSRLPVLQRFARGPGSAQKWTSSYAVSKDPTLSQRFLAMTPRRSVAITFQGSTYVGEFATEGNMLEVSFAGVTDKSRLRGSDPELSARLVLIEMVGRLSTNLEPSRKIQN
jgi:hypothetical protein